MIIFLYGPDEYRREAKRRAVVAEFSHRHAAGAVGRFDLSDAAASNALREFIANRGLFDAARLAVIASVYDADRAMREELKRCVADPTLTVLVAESAAPPAAFKFLLGTAARAQQPAAENHIVQKFEYLTGARWESYLAEAARLRGVDLDAAAARYLAAMYAGDPWRAMTELERLAGFGRRVTLNELDALGIEAAPEFFGHVLGLRSASVAARLAALERALAAREPAAKLFNVLAYQWRERLPAIARCDTAVKSGRYDYEEALMDLAVGR